jgi:lysophospholipase L1-like esterase
MVAPACIIAFSTTAALLDLRTMRVIILALALLLSACAGTAPPPAPTPGIPAQSENAAALRPFFQQLARLEDTPRQQVRILQLGDSHTAADFMSGRLREKMQSQFGHGGRGLLPPGLPFRGVRQAGFKVVVGGNWEYENSLNPRHDGPFGIGGFNTTSRAANASIAVDSETPFDRVTLSLWQQPGGGRLDVEIDGRVMDRIETGAGSGLLMKRYDASSARNLRLIAADRRPVTVLDYGIAGRSAGIVYDSLGVVGATVSIFDRWDSATVQQQIAQLQPALIILAFGTNEAYADSVDETAYASQFANAIRRVKSAAPNAAIAVIGPPDLLKPQAGCRPATQSCSWMPPGALTPVRAVQRRLAYSEGFFFWDWSSLMLASGGMGAWAEAATPLARPDRVHLSVEGYTQSADGFYDAIMRAYRDWRAGRLGS